MEMTPTNFRNCNLLYVIEIGEVIYHTITDHSKTTRSHTYRHTTSCACRIQQNTCNTLPPNAPQLERTTQSTIKTHISSKGTHTLTLFNRTNTTIILPDTQWYHTTHLPISILAMTHTLIDWNPHAYIMWTSHLPIEH